MGRKTAKKTGGVPRHVVVLAIAGVVMVSAAALPSLGQASTPEAAPATRVSEKRPLGSPTTTGTEQRGGASAPAGGAGVGGSGMVRTVLALGAVVGVILLSAALVRKFGGRAGVAAALGPGGPAPAGLLEILGRYPVVRGQSLVLLKLDRRILLLSQSTGSRAGLRSGPGGFATLCEVTNPEEVASILTKAQDAAGESLTAKFNTLLARHARGTDDDEPASPSPARSVRTTPAGDRVELTKPKKATASLGGVVAAPSKSRPVEQDASSAESLRRRLAAMRAGAGGRR